LTTQVLLALALGLSVGSFINVVADRLPRGESLLPRSHCDTCGHELTLLELVPVVSYVFLGGKCKRCGSKIPIRLPLVELLCGLGYAFLVYYFGFTLWGLKYFSVFQLCTGSCSNRLNHRFSSRPACYSRWHSWFTVCFTNTFFFTIGYQFFTAW